MVTLSQARRRQHAAAVANSTIAGSGDKAALVDGGGESGAERPTEGGDAAAGATTAEAWEVGGKEASRSSVSSLDAPLWRPRHRGTVSYNDLFLFIFLHLFFF